MRRYQAHMRLLRRIQYEEAQSKVKKRAAKREVLPAVPEVKDGGKFARNGKGLWVRLTLPYGWLTLSPDARKVGIVRKVGIAHKVGPGARFVF